MNRNSMLSQIVMENPNGEINLMQNSGAMKSVNPVKMTNELEVPKEASRAQETGSMVQTQLVTPENTNEMFANSEYLLNYLKSIPEAVNQENTQYNQVNQDQEGYTQDFDDGDSVHKMQNIDLEEVTRDDPPVNQNEK